MNRRDFLKRGFWGLAALAAAPVMAVLPKGVKAVRMRDIEHAYPEPATSGDSTQTLIKTFGGGPKAKGAVPPAWRGAFGPFNCVVLTEASGKVSVEAERVGVPTDHPCYLGHKRVLLYKDERELTADEAVARARELLGARKMTVIYDDGSTKCRSERNEWDGDRA